MIANCAGGLAQGDNFSVGCRVVVSNITVAAAAYDLLPADYHGLVANLIDEWRR